MNLRSVDARVSATKPNQSGERAGRTSFKALLLVGMFLTGGLATPSADASLLIKTTGTIASGSETGGLFGLPSGTTDLTGDSYTLIVEFDSLGPNFFTTGDGTVADDFESSPGMTGYVTAIVNGQSLTTPITNSVGSSLFEDLFGFDTSNQGVDDTGAFVDVAQFLSCASQCVPYADLHTRFNYALGPFDSGTDFYTFDGAGFPAPDAPTAMFTGTQATFAFVPEPASWLLLLTGLLGLGTVVRRRNI